MAGSRSTSPIEQYAMTIKALSDKVTALERAMNRRGAGVILSGAGTPEAAVTAPVGSIYTRTDGGATTTLYVKESGVGNTGWVAK